VFNVTVRLVLADMLQKGFKFIPHSEVQEGDPSFCVGPTASAARAIRHCDGEGKVRLKKDTVKQGMVRVEK